MRSPTISKLSTVRFINVTWKETGKLIVKAYLKLNNKQFYGFPKLSIVLNFTR